MIRHSKRTPQKNKYYLLLTIKNDKNLSMQASSCAAVILTDLTKEFYCVDKDLLIAKT